MHPFLYAAVWGWLRQGQFLGKVMDEWTDDTQEFIHSKLPHLIVVAIIAIILNRLLRLITARMIHVAEQHAPGQSRVSQVRTLAGVIRTTGAGDHCLHRRTAGSCRRGDEPGSVAGFGRGSRRGHRPGGAEHRARYVEWRTDSD